MAIGNILPCMIRFLASRERIIQGNEHLACFTTETGKTFMEYFCIERATDAFQQGVERSYQDMQAVIAAF